jgi:glycosyltransferase involved in cell wall biosynthesis
MRLIFDLFPSQTTSRLRGIGRFTLSLAKAMAAQAGNHDMRLLANGLYRESTVQLGNEFRGLVPPGAYAAYTHVPLDPRQDDLRQEQTASALIHAAYQAIGPDAILCASPFEGWGERGVVPQAVGTLPGGLKIAILYDFIPWLFPKQHLDPATDYKAWYTRRLQALRQYDLLLAISEATRHDAIRLLGIAPERVVNISGAADPQFRRLPESAIAAIDLRRHGIEKPFILYTGNSDHRKNLAGILTAFARLPSNVRDAHQLVVNQVGNVELFRMQVAAAGLRHDSVVVTGRIVDSALVALYNCCKVFVFPSLYEGFGLPVLEAMACGAAVIAGDNSSIPEVIGRADMLFDATSPQAISATLLRALTDDDWRVELKIYGIERARHFSWNKTAQVAWQAIEAAHQLRQDAAAVTRASQRMRIAVVVALPAGPSRERALERLQPLAQHVDMVITDEDGGACSLLPSQLQDQWRHFDTMLYLATIETLSVEFVTLVRSAPGVLLLLDHGDDAAPTMAPRDDCSSAKTEQLLRDRGWQGLLARQRPRGQVPALRSIGRSMLEALHCLVLEDGRLEQTLRAACGPVGLPHLIVLDRRNGAGVEVEAQQLSVALHAGAQRSWRRVPAHLASAWHGTLLKEELVDAMARHAESNLRLNRGPRILVDLTRLAFDADAFDTRMTTDGVRELCGLHHPATPVELVQLCKGSLYRSAGLAASILALDAETIPASQIDIQPGDTLVLLATSWDRETQYLPIFQTIRQFGGTIVTVIHDVPTLPPGSGEGTCSTAFPLEAAIEQSDVLMCVTPSLRDAIMARLARDQRDPATLPRVEYWAPASLAGSDLANNVARLLERPRTASGWQPYSSTGIMATPLPAEHPGINAEQRQ